MINLVAYIPVLNAQYLAWLEKHQPFRLYLINQETATCLLPRLSRNLGAVGAGKVATMIKSLHLKGTVSVFYPQTMALEESFILPDEDVCHAFAEKYLHFSSLYPEIRYEKIWARWDMTAVKRKEPVMPDMEVTSDDVHIMRMKVAKFWGEKSPDWWRQVGAIAFDYETNKIIAASFNYHMPNEYETVAFGDPRIDFDAGDPAGSDVYLSPHAEKGIVGICARDGIRLKGASVYVTTFPCADCARLLSTSEIRDLYFEDGYSSLGGLRSLKAAGVMVFKIKTPDVA